MRRLAPLALALVAACGVARTAPEPLAAEIVRAVLVVHLTDGTRCVALTPLVSGSGRFGNCPGLTWAVTADPKTEPLAKVVAEGWAILPGAGAPLVTVTGPSGTVAFGRPG